MTSFELLEGTDPRVESIWRTLEWAAAPAFFLSWGWIDNWLASLPAEHVPSLAVIADGGRPVAAFFLGKRRRGLPPSNALYMNATGDERCDDICIEHNGLLRDPSAGITLETVIEHLPRGWDELVLPAVDRTDASIFDGLDRLERRGLHVRFDKELVAPFVDLDLVRSASSGFQSLLGPQVRTQILRTRHEVGPVEIDLADDRESALDIYGELVRLRSRHGGQTDPFLERVHRRLIENRISHGEIQLVRVRADEVTLGCLYSFSYRGHVLFHQAGFEQFADVHIQPAVLCHSIAVNHNAAMGQATYDLRAGDRRDLATGVTHLVWLRVQRKLARFGIEHRLEKWRHALTSRRGRRTGSELPSRA
jgi:hypothetical protein